MPREREELFRISSIKPKEKIVILAYEGNNTEALYFEELKVSSKFNYELIYLVSLRRPKKDTKSAPIYVFTKLKKEAKVEYNFGPKDELWMLIDRDKWKNIPDISKLCKKEGNFFLALSNPCFEFWLLLHIKDISDFSPSERMDIFKNKKVSKKKTYLKRLLGSLLPEGYNESKPKPERFIPKIEIAIKRSRRLDFGDEDYPTTLGTHVYKLAEKLIK